MTSQTTRAQCPGSTTGSGIGQLQDSMHKLRRAMVRPERDEPSRRVEMDDGYWGAAEEGIWGRHGVPGR